MRLLLLTLMVIVAAPAAAQQLYRWKDENGVVHYSDQKPDNGQYETREIPPEPAPVAADTNATSPDAPVTPSSQCVTAQANLAIFETNDEVSMDLDGDGELERLDAATQARELKRARALVDAHCDD